MFSKNRSETNRKTNAATKPKPNNLQCRSPATTANQTPGTSQERPNQRGSGKASPKANPTSATNNQRAWPSFFAPINGERLHDQKR
ncbi:MAG: hypothetical protein QGG00_11550 [Verrucomicrobiota bacterium]|nr:hypothetical protein [Verrucomicrobiota bacterium]